MKKKALIGISDPPGTSKHFANQLINYHRYVHILLQHRYVLTILASFFVELKLFRISKHRDQCKKNQYDNENHTELFICAILDVLTALGGSLL